MLARNSIGSTYHWSAKGAFREEKPPTKKVNEFFASGSIRVGSGETPSPESVLHRGYHGKIP